MCRSPHHRLLEIVGITTVLLCGVSSWADESIEFARDIRPILSNKCFTCHGPDAATREADLRLDTAEGATAQLSDQPAIQPGDPAASGLMHRITANDPDLRMPPPDSGLSLSAAEIELLDGWIRGGAPYDQHWAFRPVVAPQRAGRGVSWVRNSIDQFVARTLASCRDRAVAGGGSVNLDSSRLPRPTRPATVG